MSGPGGGDAGGHAGDRAAVAAQVVVTLPDPGAAVVGPDGEPLLAVQLLGAPVRLWARASVHTTELVREFSLLTLGQATAGGDRDGGAAAAHVPARLVELASDLQARYAGITDAQENELEDALSAGDRTRDFTYRVPSSVAVACRQLLDLLDEADVYCSQGDLLTLVSPVDQQEFRRWYLGEFISQVGGAPARPWPGPAD
jgi:hypothetical protein